MKSPSGTLERVERSRTAADLVVEGVVIMAIALGVLAAQTLSHQQAVRFAVGLVAAAVVLIGAGALTRELVRRAAKYEAELARSRREPW